MKTAEQIAEKIEDLYEEVDEIEVKISQAKRVSVRKAQEHRLHARYLMIEQLEWVLEVNR